MIKPLQFQIGRVEVTVFNIADFWVDLAEWLGMQTGDRPDYSALAAPQRLSLQAVYLATPETAVLIDAPLFDPAESELFAQPGYTPPPSLLAQMESVGLAAEDVAHVVLTHAHFDHFNGATTFADGAWRPTFPRAAYYLGRADWESTEMQQGLAQPDSLARRTLSVLQQHSRLALVDGTWPIVPGVTIFPLPGESPGHQGVRLESEGAVLYAVGDLYHHALEAEQPALSCHWTDAEANGRSRAKLAGAATAEEAALIATHIPGVGRLAQTADGLRWQPFLRGEGDEGG